jgi:hypothetical protein
MLTLMHQNANVPPPPCPALEVLLAEPFPHTPQEMLQLEQRLSTAAAQTADQILLVQVTRAHEDEAFVTLQRHLICSLATLCSGVLSLRHFGSL